MAKRFLIILVVCWQVLQVSAQPACLAAEPVAWTQTSFLTGENTFGYPLASEDFDGRERSVLPVDRDLQDMPENDEDDSFRHFAEAKSSGIPWVVSRTLFADYRHAPCASLSRDIHKPPPERLS